MGSGFGQFLCSVFRVFHSKLLIFRARGEKENAELLLTEIWLSKIGSYMQGFTIIS